MRICRKAVGADDRAAMGIVAIALRSVRLRPHGPSRPKAQAEEQK
jgi:hypothetical protein